MYKPTITLNFDLQRLNQVVPLPLSIVQPYHGFPWGWFLFLYSTFPKPLWFYPQLLPFCSILLFSYRLLSELNGWMGTLAKHLCFSFEKSLVLFQKFWSLCCFLGILLYSLQQFLTLNGFLNELVLIEVVLIFCYFLIAVVVYLLNLLYFWFVLLLFITRFVLTSVAYFPRMEVPSLTSYLSEAFTFYSVLFFYSAAGVIFWIYSICIENGLPFLGWLFCPQLLFFSFFQIRKHIYLWFIRG